MSATEAMDRAKQPRIGLYVAMIKVAEERLDKDGLAAIFRKAAEPA